MKLVVNLPPEEDFIVPAGEYLVECINVFERDEPYKNQTSTSVRLKFRLLSLKHPTGEYVIGKRYPASLAPGSELRRDLELWLGKEKFNSLAKGGEFDFDKLIGERADASVVQIVNRGYDKPYCSIKKLAPPGTLTGNDSRPCVNAATCIRNLPRKLNN